MILLIFPAVFCKVVSLSFQLTTKNTIRPFLYNHTRSPKIFDPHFNFLNHLIFCSCLCLLHILKTTCSKHFNRCITFIYHRCFLCLRFNQWTRNMFLLSHRLKPLARIVCVSFISPKQEVDNLWKN